ncbi:MAG: hypothetical protein ACE5IY_20030 [bacterium]
MGDGVMDFQQYSITPILQIIDKTFVNIFFNNEGMTMKISAHFKKKYPKLSKWIVTELPKVKNKPKVWKAFQKYSELTAAQALSAVGSGSFPILHASVMPGSNGRFAGSTFPKNIYLAEAICRKFEKSDSKNAKMHILVESTILHEMVHWGDWKDGKDQPGEEGKQFEKAAYGKDIDRYW